MRVLLYVLLAIFLLLLCSIRIRAAYREEFFLKLSYLCFSYTLFPPKEKKGKKESPKKEKGTGEKENFLLGVYHEKGLSGLLRLLRELARVAGGALKHILSHVRVRRLSVNVTVACADASDTAIAYGMTCSVVYPAVAALVGATDCPRYDVAVIPDFQTNRTRVEAAADCKIRVLFLLTAAVQALFRYMKARKSAKIDPETEKTERKGGAQA